MTGRTDEIRSQMNGLLKQAVLQVEGMAGPLARSVVERLDLNPEKLMSQRNKLLGRLGAQSARLAKQDAVPLPQVVKNALGHVQAVCGAFADEGVQHGSEADIAEMVAEPTPSAPQTTPKPRTRKHTAQGTGKPTGNKRPRKRTPKTSH